MSCVAKIKHAYNSLNQSQRRIADYIIKNPADAIRLNAHGLAEATATSAATVVRFAKKIGYRGYPHLKLELALDASTNTKEPYEDQPSLTGSFFEFINQENKAYINTVQKTFELINVRTLEKVIDKIIESRRIIITGLGSSGIVCEDLYHKLARLNVNIVYHRDPHHQVANAIHMTADDVVIAISYRGYTKEVLAICNNAHKVGTPIIAITQNNGSPLANLSDYLLPVPNENNEIRLISITSRNASNIICDLIYLGVIRKQTQLSMNSLEATKEFVDEVLFNN